MERQSLNTSQWLYWLERGALLLAYYDESTDKFTSASEAGKKVTIFYIGRPDKFLLSGFWFFFLRAKFSFVQRTIQFE